MQTLDEWDEAGGRRTGERLEQRSVNESDSVSL